MVKTPNNAINADVQSAASVCFSKPVMANVSALGSFFSLD